MKFFLLISITAAPLLAQPLKPSDIVKQPPDSWPTYNGDYSGRRFSQLTQINSSNVHALSLAWATRFGGGGGPAAAGGRGGLIQIKSTPLMVNGTLYFTSPNHVWAADARTGRELWHYQYPPNTGSTIGNRGVAIWGNWLYFESPDSHLVSLDARTALRRQGPRESRPRS